MELILFGLNHRTAPVEVRERWAFSRDETDRVLRGLRAACGESEHLVISTCNRTEFYSRLPRARSPLRRAADGGPDIDTGDAPAEEYAAQAALAFYRQLKQLVGRTPSNDPSHSYFYVHRQSDAIEHLFRLAGGLDSMILGETQILGQIKKAFVVAQNAKTTGRFFHQLFPAALRVGRKIRSATGIERGCITPGQAALKLASEVFGSLSGRAVLLVGSGKIASLAAQAFRDEQIRDFTVVNRTRARADKLVAQIGMGRTAPWCELRKRLVETDLVISSTGSVEPIVSPDDLRKVQKERLGRPLVIVDLAVPRDFDPDSRDVSGVHLFHFDDLNNVIEENISRRHVLVPLAEEIVQEELLSFQGRMFYREVDPVLRHLIERFEQIRLGELQKHISQIPPEYHPVVQQLTASLVKKLLHFPIEKLKSLRDMRGLNETEVAFLKRLFLTGP